MKGGVVRRKWSSAFLFVFESLPDIFLIFLMQYFIIITFKKTGLLLFNIVDSYNDPAFMMPVLCLSALPTVFLTKNLLNSFKDEEKQLYVELALGKGMTKTYVLVVHILRNALLSLFRHFKTIFWFTLSNLFILEIMFNIRGVMKFVTLFSPMTPDLTLYVLILFVFPYLLFYFLFQLVFFRMGLDGGNEHA
jgi:peptide/nickel transport system permease protein